MFDNLYQFHTSFNKWIYESGNLYSAEFLTEYVKIVTKFKNEFNMLPANFLRFNQDDNITVEDNGKSTLKEKDIDTLLDLYKDYQQIYIEISG